MIQTVVQEYCRLHIKTQPNLAEVLRDFYVVVISAASQPHSSYTADRYNRKSIVLRFVVSATKGKLQLARLLYAYVVQCKRHVAPPANVTVFIETIRQFSAEEKEIQSRGGRGSGKELEVTKM